MLQTEYIADQLSRSGISVANIDVIINNESKSGQVFRIDTTGPSSEIFYARTYRSELAENIREALNEKHYQYMPESRLIEGDPLLLLMAPAAGYPLSRILPVFLIPGIWNQKRHELSQGIRSFGASLGRLHTSTELQRVNLNVAGGYRPIEKIKQISPTLNESQLQALKTIFEVVEKQEVWKGIGHSDPTPSNVFYRDSSVELIDVSFNTRACLADIAQGEIAIELMVKRLPYGRAKQADILIDAFQHGYAEINQNLMASDIYEIVKINRYCQLLSFYACKGHKSIKNRISRTIDTPIIKRQIKHGLENIEVA